MDTLYLTDLDGTLLGADSRLSERSARALRRFYDEGIAVTVATGRSWTALDVLAGAPLRAPMVQQWIINNIRCRRKQGCISRWSPDN